MGVPYRDLIEPAPIDGVTCMVQVERLYGFDWGLFRDDDLAELAEACGKLPGVQDAPAGPRPAWFGDDEDVPPFLTAEDEPRGLLVRGVLPEADWRLWDERFRAATAALPARKFG